MTRTQALTWLAGSALVIGASALVACVIQPQPLPPGFSDEAPTAGGNGSENGADAGKGSGDMGGSGDASAPAPGTRDAGASGDFDAAAPPIDGSSDGGTDAGDASSDARPDADGG